MLFGCSVMRGNQPVFAAFTHVIVTCDVSKCNDIVISAMILNILTFITILIDILLMKMILCYDITIRW